MRLSQPNISQVMLIDDSQSTNLYHEAIFKAVLPKINVKSFLSVDPAINYLHGHQNSGIPPQPQMIFLDLKMPEKDGFSFLEHFVKMDERLTNNFRTLVVIVSDYLDYKNFTETKTFKHLGALIQHIRKPADTDDIKMLLDEYY